MKTGTSNDGREEACLRRARLCMWRRMCAVCLAVRGGGLDQRGRPLSKGSLFSSPNTILVFVLCGLRWMQVPDFMRIGR